MKHLRRIDENLTVSPETAKIMYSEPEPLWRSTLKTVEQLPQRQDSLTDQMKDLYHIANKFGCYDAADFIRREFMDI